MLITFSDGTQLAVRHCGMAMPMLYITPETPVSMSEAAALFTPERMAGVTCNYGNEKMVYEGFTEPTVYSRDMYTGDTMIGFRRVVDE